MFAHLRYLLQHHDRLLERLARGDEVSVGDLLSRPSFVDAG